MKEPFLPLPIGWLRHPLRLRLLQKDVSHESRFVHLLLVVAESRQPGRLVAFDNRPKTVQDLSWDHDRDLDSWNAFMAFAEEIGLIEKDGETWVITNWKLFSRDPVAEEKDRHRKQMERKEAEIQRIRAELQKVTEESAPDAPEPNASESVQPRPRASKSVQDPPKASERVQKTPPIDIDIDLDLEEDLDLKKDKRKDNTACAETAAREESTPSTNRDAPATWSASLFKKKCSSNTLSKHVQADYKLFASLCQVEPRILNSKLQLSLLRTLEGGDWPAFLDDPLVQIVAIKMGINHAFTLFEAGMCDGKSAWPIALQDAERCLPAAAKICAINRDAVELGESLISHTEAYRHIATTLERQLVNSS